MSEIRKPGGILIAMELNTFQKKQTKKIIGSKNTVTNIYRILANDSISWVYVCTGFDNFMLKDKSLLEYRNSFFLNQYEENDDIVLKYFE